MVSRRKILSRSRDDLNLPEAPTEEEDVWYSKDKLLKDHIQEVLDKWEQIDDEIWAKVIVFERNRRVAKAYARAPVLTVNGSDDGFDGFRIGLNGFENPMRDSKTEDILRHIGHGIKIKMDDSGNILIKRVSKNSVFVRATAEENAISNDVTKLFNGALELDKPLKLFDMKKFASNVSRELRRAYPDRRKLEMECITAVSFVKQESELLSCPCWMMIINLVAMDMLKARIPPVKGVQRSGSEGSVIIPNGIPLPAPIPVTTANGNGTTSPVTNGITVNNNNNIIPNGQDIRNRPKIPLPEDDPYTVVGGVKTTRANGDKPPKLPPRDLNIPKPDYDESIGEVEPIIKPFLNSSRTSAKDKPQGKDRKYDDPYYCGLRARIPAFVQKALPSRKSKQQPTSAVLQTQQQVHQQPPPPSQLVIVGSAMNGGGEREIRNGHVTTLSNGTGHLLPQNNNVQIHALPPPRFIGGGPLPMMWHAKSVDSGMASIHSNPYADPLSIRKLNGNDKYSWNHTFESESDLSESIYAPIYGRLALPMRNPNTFTPQNRLFVGDWE